MKLSLGLDFGTKAVRALLVDLAGREHGVGISKYRHGQISGSLPGKSIALPPEHAFQHPSDWMIARAALESATAVIRSMASPSKHSAAVYKPDSGKGEISNTLYQKYRCLGVLVPATHPYNY